MDELRQVLGVAARGLVTPVVAGAFSFAEIRDAVALLESREQFGKVVLVP
jgi:NADPH:quinone reductase-like Zn-dependent oxidoreductase